MDNPLEVKIKKKPIDKLLRNLNTEAIELNVY